MWLQGCAFFIALLSFQMVSADGLRPKDFVDSKGNKITFVDFQEVQHQILYNVTKQTAEFVTTISFVSSAEGAPVFDLVEEPLALELDGQKATQVLMDSPDKSTKFRVVALNIKPGKHILKVAGLIKKNVEFSAEGVKSGFWMTDLSDRGYTERYLPTNLEYDQFATKIDAVISGSQKKHVLFTNGKFLSSRRSNSFSIVFPEKFTTSSLFFHLGPEDAYETQSAVFVSKTGRAVPVGVYKQKGSSESLDAFMKRAQAALKELEETYGPYLHPTVVIYAAGSGGMEYCGATITSLSALSHELGHSWFARGVMPSNGNAGWMDEAITSWRDGGYKKVPSISGNRPMADHGEYNRTTDDSAYGFGASFIGHLHAQVPNFIDFMRHLFLKKNFSPLTTEDFANELSTFTGKDFTALFKKHVYRTEADRARRIFRRAPAVPNPNHPLLTDEQMRRLL
ncbi:MAG: hypothetical protein K2X47_07450 [Bdellovibrionales bacterium]|nr:hypothetical protein [Bdellovibrionales bacterium]